MTDINFPALEAKREELARIFKDAGDDYDLTKVQIEGCSTSTEKAAHVRKLNDECAELQNTLGIASRGYGFESGDGARGGFVGGSGVKGSAMRSLDVHVKSGLLPDYAASRVEKLMSAGSSEEQTLSQKWAAATGNPEYLSAFVKQLADPTKGHMLWTQKEASAYRAVHQVKAAMSITATHGLEMVPLVLDPAIMLTNAGGISPLRAISRVVQTSADKWRGVTSAGATAEWKAEAAEAADGSPTTANADIPVYMADVDVVYSYEVGMDALDFGAQLQEVVMDAAANHTDKAYAIGTGSGQPTGVVNLVAGSKVAATTADTLVSGDVIKLQNALPPRFSANAQWCANRKTINQIAVMETANGARLFPEVSDDRLLGKPLNELSYLNAAGDTASAGNDNVLLYGDFSRGFVIVDRIGATVEIIPDVGTNRRPTGQRHYFMTWRTGSDVVVDNAFRLLTA